MAIVINDPYAQSGGGGSEFGKSIGSALENLANRKLQMLENRYQQAQQLKNWDINQQIQQAMQQQQHVQGQQRWQQAGLNESDARLMHQLQGSPKQFDLLMALHQAGRLRDDSQPQLVSNQQQESPELSNNVLQTLSSRNAPMQGLQALLGGQPQQVSNQQQAFQPQQAMAKANIAPMRNQAQGNRFGNYMTPAQQTSELRRVDAKTKKFTEKVSKDLMNALATRDAAQEALGLIESGQTRSGIAGNLPFWLLPANEETRELNKIYEDLALTLAASSGGVLSRAKLTAARATKPSLDMPIGAQKYMLNRIIDKAEREGIALDAITNRIIEENNGRAPEDIEKRALEEWKKSYISKKEDNTSGGITSGGMQLGKNNQGGINLGTGSGDQDALTNALKLGAGVGKQVIAGGLGGAGDLLSAGFGAANYVANKSGIGSVPSYSDIQSKLPLSLPTSEDISNRIDKWTGGYTAPQGGFEEALQDAAGAFGSLFMPAKAAGVLAKGFSKLGASGKSANLATKILLPFSGVQLSSGRAMKLAAAGTLGAKTAEAMGGDPITQTMGRLTATVLAGYPGPRKAFSEAAHNNYELAKKEFGSDKTSIVNLKSEIGKLEKKFLRENIPYRDEMDDILSGVKTSLAQSKDGKMSVNELIKLKQGLNARFSWSETPKIQGDKGYLPRELRGPLGELIDEVKQPIDRAAVVNPKAGKSYFLADDITRGLNKTEKSTQWLKRYSHLGQHAHSFSGILLRMAAGLTLGGFEHIAKIKDFFKAYPPARKYYLNIIDAASKENKAAFIKNLAQLDKISRHYENR